MTAQPRRNLNALPAGGPSTAEGKARSSQNSLRHGLTAKQTVIPGEDRAEFDELHDNLISDRKPSGELEHQLVGEIAACMWRLARARRHEARLLHRAHDLYGDSAPELQLVIRYIGSIERELHRTIARLDRTQSDRRKTETQQQPAVQVKVMAAGSPTPRTVELACTSPESQFVSHNYQSLSADDVATHGEFVSQNAALIPELASQAVPSPVRFAS